MSRLLLAAFLLLAASAARAKTYTGSAFTGGPLALVNGDVLSGTFQNVSLMTLPAGATAYVDPATSLVIYASTVQIAGTLDGSGRGMFGGNAGQASGGTGQGGSDGSGIGISSGTGGTASHGGGGGAGGGDGGWGSTGTVSGVPAAGGTGYGSTGTLTLPLSADDALQGSGGGGGGANGTLNGGGGAPGGASIYIEAASMTVTGVIRVDGSTATPVTDGNPGTHPGGGGGGGGGTILVRITGQLQLAQAQLSANGGKGGNVDTAFGGTLDPGGGGGGGRIKLFSQTLSASGVALSTAAGAAGFRTSGFTGSMDAFSAQTGSTGTVSFGQVAAPPTAFAAQGVHITSISWNWTGITPAQFGDGPSTATYHIYASTVAPLPAPQLTSTAVGAAETGLAPNTTYFRVVTAYTDWGDSSASNFITTHTLANVPGAAAAAFSGMGDVTATFNWTANSPANPGYTVYEVDRSSDANFGQAVSTGYVVGVSSAPAGLLPNTTYYWRVRAVNLDGIPSDFAAVAATATLATAPSAPAFGSVFVTSASFTWARGANPADTVYEAQVSTDNFFTLAAASSTLLGSATFFDLNPGTQYFFRAFALNRESVASAFSAVISTRSGNLSDVSAPTAPGKPVADRQFSYDGTAVFAWSPSQSSVGILDYHLIIGSTPGGNDVVDVTTAAPVYDATNLGTGRSYYARVAARSNAGVTSQFSDISMGLPVFIPAQSNPLAKAINWPNPFDPSAGPTQIGFTLDAPADVELKIFTLNGHQVHSQSYSFGAAGNQIVTWDGHNDSGAKVAPGGYIGLVLKKYAGHTDSQKLKIAVVY